MTTFNHVTTFNQLLEEHRQLFDQLATLDAPFQQAADQLNYTLKNGGKVLLCGNGGSAADAQHIAAEIVGRFEVDRHALAAIALTTDSSILTAVANDFGFDEVFARQVQGLGQKGDVLIAYSTSGNSKNVLQAVQCASEKGMPVIALTGNDGGALASKADISLNVPHTNTARIQEAHAFLGHALCAAIDAENGSASN